jgi:hypothetical protein
MSKHAKLIASLKECLAKEFSARLAAAVGEVSIALFEVANDTDDGDRKRAILGARDVWESTSLTWEEAIRDDYRTRFDEKLSDDQSKLSKTMSFSLDSLKLVDDDEMREDILLGNVSKRMQAACDYELFALTKRLESLAEVNQLVERQNPLFPRSFCRALLAGLNTAGANVMQRCEILGAGEAVIGALLNAVLKEGNELLVSHGFMIEIPARYGKPINRSSVSRLSLSGSGSGGGGGGGGGSGGGGSGGGGSGSGSGGGGGDGGGAQDIRASLPSLFAKLLNRAGATPPATGAAPTSGAETAGSIDGPAASGGASTDQLLAQLLTNAAGMAGSGGGQSGGASGGHGGAVMPQPTAAGSAPAGGGVSVVLDPKLIEALERFAAANVSAEATAAGAAMGGQQTAFSFDAAKTAGLPSAAAGAANAANAANSAGPTGAEDVDKTQNLNAVPQADGAGDANLAFPAITDSAETAASEADKTLKITAVAPAADNDKTQPLPAVMARAAPPPLTNLVRQAQPVLAPQLQPAQTVITEVMVGFFDRIFEAGDIPDTVKALIARLQLHIFRAAMQQPQIFTDSSHPFRRFIDQLADIGVKRQKALVHGDAVYEQIAKIVQTLHQNFDTDPKAVEKAESELAVFIAAEEESAQGTIFDSVVQVQQEEEVEMSQSMAAFEVDKRLTAKHYPSAIQDFAKRLWQPVLAADYQVDAEDGAQWKADLATLDDLLWSVAHDDNDPGRPKLIKMLPKLLGQLNKALDRTRVPADIREPYFKVMAAIHTSALRKTREPLPEIALPEGTVAMTINPVDPRANLRKRSVSIERGQWLEMVDEDGEVQRCRLSWVSPLKETFVLKNYDTKAAITLRAEEWKALQAEGRIRPIEEHSLTERSIEGAVRGLLDAPAEETAT